MKIETIVLVRGVDGLLDVVPAIEVFLHTRWCAHGSTLASISGTPHVKEALKNCNDFVDDARRLCADRINGDHRRNGLALVRREAHYLDTVRPAGSQAVHVTAGMPDAGVGPGGASWSRSQ